MMPLETFGGLRIVVDPGLVEAVPHPRSPARARRRARYGHKQHSVIRPCRDGLVSGNTLLVHPTVWAVLRPRLQAASPSPRIKSGAGSQPSPRWGEGTGLWS